MKIIIIVTMEEYGTEIGELCPTSYSYQCVEETVSIDLQDEPIYMEIQKLPENLKIDFLNKMATYLNNNYRDYKPSDYQSIIDNVLIMTIKGSSMYATNAVFGLFSTCTNLDTANLIADNLDRRDIKNITATTLAAYHSAHSAYNYGS